VTADSETQKNVKALVDEDLTVGYCGYVVSESDRCTYVCGLCLG